MKSTILVLLTMLAPLVASADDLKPIDVKTGLWETTSKTEITGMPAMAMPQIPEDTLAKMPPEQRARVEAMMKGRGMGGPQTNTTKSCLTKEALERGLNFQNDKQCTTKLTSSSFGKQEIHLECNRNNMQMAGDVVIDRLDSEHLKGSGVIKTVGGMNMTIKMSYETKFLSSDCGDVKPYVPPAK
jgi:hypothetical protein